MIIVSGKTFDQKEFLKSLGGQWDASAQSWQFHNLTDREVARLRGTVGLIVTDLDTLPPAPMPDTTEIDALLAAILSPDEARQINSTGNAVYGDDPRYLNYFKDQNPLAFFGFSNLAAMVDYVEQIPPHKRTGERDTGYEPGTWHGTPDMAAAIALARDGWQEGADNAAEVVELLSVPHALQRRRVYAVEGGQVSVGRMLAGDPAHMIQRPKLPGRKMVTLFVETAASAVIKIENLIVRAAIIAAIADILESNGYSCEIVALETNSTGNKPGSQTAVTVKAAGEKLNLNDMVFALGHPSFLRRLQFACVCSADECRPIWENQGVPAFAFNDHHKCKQNEFYIRPLLWTQQQDIIGTTLRTRALSMLEFVKPTNLPIDIKGEW